MTRKRRVEHTPVIPEAALEALIGTTRTPEELEELFRAMQKRVVERMLGAELSHHLGYGPAKRNPRASRIIGTGRRRRRCSRTMGRCRWRCPAIAPGRSSRS